MQAPELGIGSALLAICYLLCCTALNHGLAHGLALPDKAWWQLVVCLGELSHELGFGQHIMV